ncbi:MAG: hypothetical protein KJ964_08600 [Verrucomicrobia bacterium]|nr:hypothetical protein [Verrucomicrobiota bacterium]MBU1733763.1 hypothetical protein [Verrucomicrobiota bacterium]
MVALTQGAFAGITNTIPFADDFEVYTNGTPLINGTNGWYGSSSSIIVQTNTVYTGTNAAMIPCDSTLSNRFVPASPTNVWIQMDTQPSLYDVTNNPVVATNMAAMFYINTDGYFVVHNGIATNAAGSFDPSNSVNWVIVTNASVPTNAPTWVRISIYEKFSTTNWDLYANGVLVTNNIGFINTNLTNFSWFDLYNGSTTSYLDNVSVAAIDTNEVIGLPLVVGPASLEQSIVYGDTPAVQTVRVVNAWGSAIGFRVDTNQAWLAADPAGGIVAAMETQTVTLTYNAGGWPVGTSNATVTVVATNGAGDEWSTQSVAVALSVTRKAVILSGSRDYDGTATATNTILTVTNTNGLDVVTVTSGLALLASKDVGTPAITNQGDLVLGGSAAGNYTLDGLSGSVTISQLAVTLSGSRDYDGTTEAEAAILTIGNNLDGGDLTLSGTAQLASKDVGSRAILAGTLALGGSAAGNYTLSGLSGSVTIGQLAVALSGSRDYDGTTDALAAILTIDNNLDGGDLTLSGTAQLASKDVGSRTISAGTLALGGSAAGNYTLSGLSGSVTIAAKTLTASLIGTVTKVYDGLFTATNLVNGNYSLSGLVLAELPTINQTNGTYATKDVASGISVSATLAAANFDEVAGFLRSNYSLPGSAVGLVGVITIADQTLTFPAIPAQPLASGSMTLNASASSGLTVTFTNIGSLGTNISGSSLTFNGPGVYTIIASQTGDVNFLPADSVTNTFPVYGFSPQTNTIPWSDDFENYYNREPLINGTNGWYGDSADIIVQTNIVATGTNAAMIPLDGTLSNSFVAGAPCNVRIAMDLRPVRTDLAETDFPPVDTNAAVLFYVDTNGHFVVCNGSGGTPTWCMVSNAVGSGGEFVVTNDTWANIVIYLDYRYRHWKLKANNVLITNKIGFVTQQTNAFSGFSFYNGSSTCYVDNVAAYWWDRFKVNGVFDHMIRSVNGVIPDSIMGVPTNSVPTP